MPPLRACLARFRSDWPQVVKRSSRSGSSRPGCRWLRADARVAELETAGWVELGRHEPWQGYYEPRLWLVTDKGKAVLDAVRP